MRYYEPGELVPPFEIMDAVSSGKYPAGYTWIGYDQGTIPALPLYSGAPFNMEPPAHLAWYYQGDGKKLLEEIYAQRNIHPMLCSIIGPEGAGWFAKPIEKLEDFDGLRIRFAGIGGKVLEKLGASVTMVPGGEIYQRWSARPSTLPSSRSRRWTRCWAWTRSSRTTSCPAGTRR